MIDFTHSALRALLFLAVLRFDAAVAEEFAVELLAPGVYVHRGHMADLDSPLRGDSANIGFVVGERCVAVIDTGGAVATGRALARAVERVAAKPVCYVINTHVHFDHVLGNAAFAAADAPIVGHRALAEAMAANRDFFADSFPAELGGADLQALVIGPDTLVDDTLAIDLGARRLTVRADATAHSTTDLTVFDHASGTLWAGDLLSRERMPVLDGSLLGWLTWMTQAMQESYIRVIPGHGPVDADWPAGAQAQLRYLEALRDQTRAAVAAGTLLEDAPDSVAAEERARWQLTERAHRLNVSRAYRELEWE